MKPEEAISLFKWAEQQVGNAEHIELAISALEKQIPKKPVKVGSGVYDYDYDYKCQNCKSDIDENEYCWDCGQHIDWSVSE